MTSEIDTSPAKHTTEFHTTEFATGKMAEAITEGTAKLQLDEETGEFISKGELKKRLAKRAKKAAKEVRAKETKDTPKAAPKPKPKTEEVVMDPEAMFKQGFLNDVYNERPVKPVVTRFPPEPNG